MLFIRPRYPNHTSHLIVALNDRSSLQYSPEEGNHYFFETLQSQSVVVEGLSEHGSELV
jgi:hypothetical protein